MELEAMLDEFFEKVNGLRISDLESEKLFNLREECQYFSLKKQIKLNELKAQLNTLKAQQENTLEFDEKRKVQLNTLKSQQAVCKAQLNTLKVQQAMLEAQQAMLEAKSKINGTFFEDCDGLWTFEAEKLPETKEERIALFNQISRDELRECYRNIDTLDWLSGGDLPDPSMRSLGSASFRIEDTTDIFNNMMDIERAHLLPDSPICAPKWGHSAEGALKPLNNFDDEKEKNKARMLLAMGTEDSIKLRRVPQNFIKFAYHKSFFDVDPSVVIIPILPLKDVRDTWQADVPYDALVIASTVNKPDVSGSFLATQTYRNVLSNIDYDTANVCTVSDIETATSLIRAFLVGHAGSLAAGIPIEIDADHENIPEKVEVLDSLKKVQKNIIKNGILLPKVRTRNGTQGFGKVLKIRFENIEYAPIPDPWLLAAKAAVNLSSTRGQKLLPVYKKDEEEDSEEDDSEEVDSEMMKALHEYFESSRRQGNVLTGMDITCSVEEVPATPSQSSNNGIDGVAANTCQSHVSGAALALMTPTKEGREEEEDWETLGD